ncbi:MAG: TetR/AcrR family transcriptional regulator [Pseudomonadota bacterium]
MNTLTRKQREIQQRRDLMLDIAERLIDEGGHQALSMDRIAELSEYSKGTVYQHFPNKEEVLIAICLRSMNILTDMFERANQFDGGPRDRMTAICVAHILYAKLNPLQFNILQTIKAGSVKEKIHQETREQHLQSERRCLSVLVGIIQDGVASGDLVLPEELSPVDVVFGLWASSYGSLVLQTYDIDFDEIGLPDPNKAMLRILRFTLDGMGWKPLSSESDLTALRTRIENEIFADEMAMLVVQGGAGSSTQ